MSRILDCGYRISLEYNFVGICYQMLCLSRQKLANTLMELYTEDIGSLGNYISLVSDNHGIKC